MPKLTLLVGPPGSGKSTLAGSLCRPGEVIWINQDTQGKGHMAHLNLALKQGLDVVVDRMNFDRAQRSRYLSAAKAAGYETEIIVLQVPRQVCLQRMAVRTGHPTIQDEKSASSALNTFFSKYERPTPNEADRVLFHRYGEDEQPFDSRPEAIIVDLDGTLCNIDHRLHWVRNEDKKLRRWDKFFQEIPGDSVNQWCHSLMAAMSYGLVGNDGHKIVLCSGRPDSYRPHTKIWLTANQISYAELFMRPRNDFRRDDIVKEILLDFEILPRYRILFAVDDRQQVVDMWRRRDITCLQCAPGDF